MRSELSLCGGIQADDKARVWRTETLQPLTKGSSSLWKEFCGIARSNEVKPVASSTGQLRSTFLATLVAQSVEMARLDTLDIAMNLSPQNTEHLVESALQAASPVLGTYAITMRMPPDLPMIEADSEWLIKLIVNLLENAAKYSAVGEPVFVTAEPRGDVVAISIADRGIGIDPLEQGLIIDKFYRSRERAGNVSGTGMGLATCRAIANAHRGTIEVTSQPGRGSVFTFTVRIAL